MGHAPDCLVLVSGGFAQLGIKSSCKDRQINRQFEMKLGLRYSISKKGQNQNGSRILILFIIHVHLIQKVFI
jgi:hypothetical protein